ncbi:MAG TPA: aspartate-semialdehyde dehydrogenase [Gammaproteobacteria bacterium]|nr:aspartate-semialdehyde dehydrogenase [Gammaproteobacteria bacterium]
MRTFGVVGATGLVGQELLRWGRRLFPAAKFVAIASARSQGKTLVIDHDSYKVENIDDVDWGLIEGVFFSAGASVSRKWVPRVVDAGCWVVDNSSAFRQHASVPLIIPEINGRDNLFEKHRIIANPNCSTIQMLLALNPIRDIWGIKRLTVSTYQSYSGAGQRAMEGLVNNTEASLSNQNYATNDAAFSLVPSIGKMAENGFCEEEMKMIHETQKIWGDKSLEVEVTTVRVPTIYTHAESICIDTHQPIDLEEVKSLFSNISHLELCEDYPNIQDIVNTPKTAVGRLRKSLNDECRLHLWVVADNILRGAAYNALQIADKYPIINKEELKC